MDDPAVAFAALRTTVEGLAGGIGREMATIRRGVETALTRFEAQDAPADYSADLGRIVQQLGAMSERLQAVEQSPVLRQGAEHYALTLERGGEGLVRGAVQGLERQAADLERIGRQMTGRLAAARERRDQERWIFGACSAGVVAGMLLVLFVPRVLPGAVGLGAAATVLGSDHWNAGATLMQSGSASGWEAIVEAHGLAQANKEALAGCREAAARAGREQRCTIVVGMPGR